MSASKGAYKQSSEGSVRTTEAPNLSRKEFIVRLDELWELDRLFPAVIQARVALRLMPDVGRMGHFDFWVGEKQARKQESQEKVQARKGAPVQNSRDLRAYNLLAVFTCLSIIIGLAQKTGRNPKDRIKPVERDRLQKTRRVFVSTNYSSVPFDISYASLAAAYATELSAIAADVDYASYVSRFAAIDDLIFCEKGASIIELIERPLWPSETPDWFGDATLKFTTAVENLQREVNDEQREALGLMLDQYFALVNGKAEKEPQRKTIEKSVASAINHAEADAAVTDHLNRQGLVDGLAKIISSNQNSAHLTVGLLGHWGAGKTRVLNLLRDSLKARRKNNKNVPQFLFGEFNAWAYEHSDNIQAGMSHEVIKSLTSLQSLKSYEFPNEKDSSSWFDQCIFYLKIALENCWRRITWGVVIRPYITFDFVTRKNPLYVLGSLASIVALYYLVVSGFDLNKDFTWGAFFSAENIPAVGIAGYLIIALRRLSAVLMQSSTKEFLTYVKLPSYAKHIGQISSMREDIRAMCDLRLKFESENKQHWLGKFRSASSRKRLLFVVDDLDRCGPEGIVKTFEAIRLVLDIPQVIVVIAIDQRIALAALASHYESLQEHHQLKDAKSIARDYLGKMIHLPIVLQNPDMRETIGYMAYLWSDEGEQLKWKSKLITQVDVEEPSTEEEHHDNAPSEIDGDGGEGENLTASETDELDNDEEPIDQGPITEEELFKLIKSFDQPQKTEVDEVEVPRLTDNQKAAFVYWADYLDITNPRQLKRMENSYNLLRLVSGREDDELSGTDHGFGLMVALLALEFISSQEGDRLRCACRVCLFGDVVDKNAIPQDVLTKIQTAAAVVDHYINVRQSLVSDLGNAAARAFATRKDVLDFANLFVLPGIE